MKHKGKELKEITTPQVFDPPKEMIVWGLPCGGGAAPEVQLVYAIVRTIHGTTQAVGEWRWSHCAEIPEEAKPRRATIREFSKWLAQGKGEYKTGTGLILTSFSYDNGWKIGEPVDNAYMVRKWEDTEWHEPTVDYMGIDLPLPGPSPDELLDYQMRVVDMPTYLENSYVKIGNQVWMSENLFVHDGGDGIHWNKDNGEWYYSWEAAMRIAGKIPGWHLPSSQEWNELVKSTGNDAANLRDKSWYGTDKYGFSAVPAGYWYYGFSGVGSYTIFRTSEPNGSYAWYRRIDIGTSVYEGVNYQYYGFSVRLVKDK